LAGLRSEAGRFEGGGALAEPMSFGHSFDEDGFGDGDRVVLAAQSIEKPIEFGLVFGGQNFEGGAGNEAVAEVILRRGGFAGFRFGTGAVLGIALISGDLRLRGHMREFGSWVCGVTR
jgi:hypothetical protein